RRHEGVTGAARRRAYTDAADPAAGHRAVNKGVVVRGAAEGRARSLQQDVSPSRGARRHRALPRASPPRLHARTRFAWRGVRKEGAFAVRRRRVREDGGSRREYREDTGHLRPRAVHAEVIWPTPSG